MKRVAYLLLGHMRTFKNTNFYTDVLAKFPGDVFIATIDETNKGSGEVVDDNYFKDLKITEYQIFNEKEIFDASPYKEPYLKTFLCPIYCHNKVYEMAIEYAKRHNFEYDIFVFTRPDLYYFDFNLHTPLATINSKEPLLYMSKSNNGVKHGLFADHVRVCNQITAPIMLNAFNLILSQMVNNYSPESFITTNLLDSKLPIKFLDFGLAYLRMNNCLEIIYLDDFPVRVATPDFYQKAFNRVKRKDLTANKLAAVYILFDDFEFMDLSLQNVTQFCDKTFILINKKRWRGEAKRDEVVLQNEIDFLRKKYPQVQIEHTDFEHEHEHEHEQRNYGLDLALKNGCDWCLVVDTDEVWEDKELGHLKVELINAPPDVIGLKSKIFTYWKFLSGEQSLYRIEPPEEFTPYLVVSTKIFRFNDKRNGESLVKDPKMLLGGEPWMHHFSYTRSDDYILKKISTFSHSHEITQNWYEEKWLKWTPDMLDIHPTTPSQYKKAVKVDLNTLPKEIRDFFKAKK